MAKPVWTAQQIEMAVAGHFNPRQNLIVPNVSWGLFRYHEADLIVLSKANWCSEVEIKVTAQDIKADQKKRHEHFEDNIRDLWFAVPKHLENDDNIPVHAGILSIERYHYRKHLCYRVVRKRLPVSNKKARKFTDAERNKLLRLGCLRIWMLKAKLDEHRSFLKEKVTGWTDPKKVDLPLYAKDSKWMKVIQYGDRDEAKSVYRNCKVVFAITEKGIWTC